MIRYNVKLATALVLTAGASMASAQEKHSLSVGVDYTYVRTNILPGCNCVSLQGGGTQAQLQLNPRLALLAELTVTHKDGITSDGYSLTQLVYTAGSRVFLGPTKSRWQPFGEVKFGATHAFGTLAPSRTGYGGANALAFEAGGGISVRLSPRLALLPFRADYLLTNFNNNRQNDQNDLRLSAGALWRF